MPKDSNKVQMGYTVVRLPFGGRASTQRSEVRRVAPGRLFLAFAGLAVACVIFFR